MPRHRQYDRYYTLPNLNIPVDMWGPIQRWVDEGIKPGDFLGSVIKNDLRKACMYADIRNQSLIFNYVTWFYNHAPSGCWGSEENYNAWAEQGGLKSITGDFNKVIPDEEGLFHDDQLDSDRDIHS